MYNFSNGTDKITVFTFQIFPSPACVVFSTWEIFLFVCASDTFGGVCNITYSLNITDDRRRADDGGLKYSPDPFVLCCLAKYVICVAREKREREEENKSKKTQNETQGKIMNATMKFNDHGRTIDNGDTN